jgi:hypothetical protein
MKETQKMAKYVTATRSCGHTERVLVNYKITDMEEWESRQAEQLCLMRKEDLLRFFKSNLSVEQARKLVKGEAL